MYHLTHTGRCEVNINSTCHEFNCSGCIQRNMDINKWCKDLENYTNGSVDVVGEPTLSLESTFCKCDDNATKIINVTGPNKCGEKL